MTASYHLDPEEQQLLDDVESGSMRSVASPELQEGLRAAARATGLKDQRINIRLSSVDLQALRTRALQEGMPYQTLISSVLHKYLSGTLLESPTPIQPLQSMPVIDQSLQKRIRLKDPVSCHPHRDATQCLALQELSEAARRAGNTELVQALPSAALDEREILEALRQSRADRPG